MNGYFSIDDGLCFWKARDKALATKKKSPHKPERGDEPLFAWIRLSVADIVEALPLEGETAPKVLLHRSPVPGLKTVRINGVEAQGNKVVAV